MSSAVAAARESADTDHFRSQLRNAGLRVTGPRIAVLAALTHHPHSRPEALFQLVRAELPGTSLPAVYNVMGRLTRAGIPRSIEPAASVASYAPCSGAAPHHPRICTHCGQVRDVECVPAAAPCLQPSQDHGFAISEAEVTFWGVCPSCAGSQQDIAVDQLIEH